MVDLIKKEFQLTYPYNNTAIEQLWLAKARLALEKGGIKYKLKKVKEGTYIEREPMLESEAAK